MTHDLLSLYRRYYKSKKDNSAILIVKVLDIFVVFPTLFQNFNGKVRRALIIK